MFYFDPNLLRQYVDQSTRLKICVNHEWFEIAEMSDLSSNKFGLAYDINGNPTKYDYRDISIIKVGNRRIDLDQLQTMLGGEAEENPEDGKTSGGGSDEEPPSEEPAEEEPSEEPKGKEPTLDWFSPHFEIGRLIVDQAIKEKKRKMKR